MTWFHINDTYNTVYIAITAVAIVLCLQSYILQMVTGQFCDKSPTGETAWPIATR